jgi:2-polyprenyl-3-methyl-5-hydroxy-6-metoxy-1,4-benzoquinol methylase
MTYDLDHWRNPRKTIATIHQHNDIAYATHGAKTAIEVIRGLDIPYDKAKVMRLLDYGCGTGRIARVLTSWFGHVTAYDPVPECIALARTECPGINFHTLTLISSLENLQTGWFDTCCSINVMEHLTEIDQQTMISNVRRLLKPGGSLLLWYSIRLNRKVLIEHFGDHFVAEDERRLAEFPGANIQVRRFFFGR